MSHTDELRTRRMFNTLAVALFLALLLALTVAALTRPIDRSDLPRRLDEIAPALRALHQGPEPCVRWPRDTPLDATRRSAFLDALRQDGLAVDLRVLLPILSSVRERNRVAALKHHPATPREEVEQAALAHLSSWERWRLGSGGHDLDLHLPMLQRLDESDRRHAADRRRARALTRHLSAEERDALDALIEAWRRPLASPATQAALAEFVAEEVTTARMNALAEGLHTHVHHYGEPPDAFSGLLDHLRRTNRLHPIIERGLETDGSLRDGWLRPFEYYRVGARGYRLTSSGPSDETERDDLVISP